MFDAYFIQYKFIIPDSMKHSSYTYQKIFRALYGYTQSVAKSNGKTYTYHRHGVLSEVPYIRPGKNCVVIPKETLSRLIDFFKTGKNPAHHWESKGDWKAVYYMDEKSLDQGLVVRALEQLVDRTYVPVSEGGHGKLSEEMRVLLEKRDNGEEVNRAEKEALAGEAQRIMTLPWFKQSYSKSDKLKQFSDRTQKLRNR
jgi:hypothetical protein